MSTAPPRSGSLDAATDTSRRMLNRASGASTTQSGTSSRMATPLGSSSRSVSTKSGSRSAAERLVALWSNGKSSVSASEGVARRSGVVKHIKPTSNGTREDLLRECAIAVSKKERSGAVVSPSLTIDPSKGKLREQVAKAFSRQQKFNDATLQLSGLNYAIGLATAMEGHRLKSRIQSSESQVVDLESSMVEEQSAYLEERTHENAEILAHTLRENQAEREAQANVFRERQAALQSVEADCTFSLTKGIDITLGLISLWIVNTVFVDFPLRLILAYTPYMPRGLARSWSRQFIKVLLAFRMAGKARTALLGGGNVDTANYLATLRTLWTWTKAFGMTGHAASSSTSLEEPEAKREPASMRGRFDEIRLQPPPKWSRT